MSEKEQLVKDTLRYIQNDFVGSPRGKYLYHRMDNPDINVFATVLLPDGSYGYINSEGFLGKIEKQSEMFPDRTIMVDSYDQSKIKPINMDTPITDLISIVNKLTNSMYTFNEKLRVNA